MSSNKTEKPTKKRLEDSAKKGQSFKSKDLIIACLTLGGIAYLVSYGSFNEFMGIIRLLLRIILIRAWLTTVWPFLG